MVQENKGFKQKYKNARVTYKEQIKEHVRDLTMRDLKLRILSFMVDAIFMFWPSFIFIISILLLTSPANIGGEMIRNTFELLIVYITSIFIFNTASSLIFRGQSIGMRYYGIKVVTRKKNELKTYQIILREVIGISCPWACILLMYTIIGFNGVCLAFLAFIAINFIIILADPKHRSFIDIIFNTTIVVLPDMDEINANEEQEVSEDIKEESLETEEEMMPVEETVDTIIKDNKDETKDKETNDNLEEKNTTKQEAKKDKTITEDKTPEDKPEDAAKPEETTNDKTIEIKDKTIIEDKTNKDKETDKETDKDKEADKDTEHQSKEDNVAEEKQAKKEPVEEINKQEQLPKEELVEPIKEPETTSTLKEEVKQSESKQDGGNNKNFKTQANANKGSSKKRNTNKNKKHKTKSKK